MDKDRRGESRDELIVRVGERVRRARQVRGLSLSQLGGAELTRGFLSSVENGRSGISLQALDLVANRLKLPLTYFVDDSPELTEDLAGVSVDHAEAALAYSLYLRTRAETERALDYALWAATAMAEREGRQD